MGRNHLCPRRKEPFFNISMKVSSEYWAPDQYFNLQMDGHTVAVKVLVCGGKLCVAVPTRKPQDIAKMTETAGDEFLSSKTAALVFPAAAGQKAATLDIPLDGLQLGAAALRRVDVLNTD